MRRIEDERALKDDSTELLDWVAHTVCWVLLATTDDAPDQATFRGRVLASKEKLARLAIREGGTPRAMIRATIGWAAARLLEDEPAATDAEVGPRSTADGA